MMMSNLMNMDEDGYSLSTREMRRLRRSEKKETTQEYGPIVVEFIDEEEKHDIDFYDKENTRRIKRSHEKKQKKVVEKEYTVVAENNYVTEKKDNTRRGRREIVEPKQNEKKVTFEVEKPLKAFRIPAGKFIKEKNIEENIRIPSVRYSKRLLNVDIKNYYESDYHDDSSDSDYDDHYDIGEKRNFTKFRK